MSLPERRFFVGLLGQALGSNQLLNMGATTTTAKKKLPKKAKSSIKKTVAPSSVSSIEPSLKAPPLQPFWTSAPIVSTIDEKMIKTAKPVMIVKTGKSKAGSFGVSSNKKITQVVPTRLTKVDGGIGGASKPHGVIPGVLPDSKLHFKSNIAGNPFVFSAPTKADFLTLQGTTPTSTSSAQTHVVVHSSPTSAASCSTTAVISTIYAASPASGEALTTSVHVGPKPSSPLPNAVWSRLSPDHAVCRRPATHQPATTAKATTPPVTAHATVTLSAQARTFSPSTKTASPSSVTAASTAKPALQQQPKACTMSAAHIDRNAHAASRRCAQEGGTRVEQLAAAGSYLREIRGKGSAPDIPGRARVMLTAKQSVQKRDASFAGLGPGLNIANWCRRMDQEELEASAALSELADVYSESSSSEDMYG